MMYAVVVKELVFIFGKVRSVPIGTILKLEQRLVEGENDHLVEVYDTLYKEKRFSLYSSDLHLLKILDHDSDTIKITRLSKLLWE